jgi:hypothetical protein
MDISWPLPTGRRRNDLISLMFLPQLARRRFLYKSRAKIPQLRANRLPL